VEDLEDMGAFDAFVIVEGHGKRLRPFSGFGLRVGENRVLSSPMTQSGIRKPVAR
jgi:hypothetical protein